MLDTNAQDDVKSDNHGADRRSVWAWRRIRQGLSVFAVFVLAYVLLAYIVLPALWRHYEHHPAMLTAPKTTVTREGTPSDPLNVGLVGERSEILNAMLAAGWLPADPVTLRTSVDIAAGVLLHRPYEEAPVSNLYLWGRRQDLAFEQPAGHSPKTRHHVRFWQSEEFGISGRSFWLGAATFDRGVGISHLTGQITHHISPDMDAERDKLVDDLQRAGQLVQIFQVTGVGATLTGRNGGGDWYYTDGELTVEVVAVDNAVQANPPAELPNPDVVKFKDRIYGWFRHPSASQSDQRKETTDGGKPINASQAVQRHPNGSTFECWLSAYGYVALFVLLMVGIVGLPIPDETLLSTAGVLLYRGELDPIPTFIAAVVGSWCGITLSYIIGRTVGYSLFTKYPRLTHVTPERLEKVHRWFDRVGKWLLTFGYFLPGLRHLTALVAGTSKLQLLMIEKPT